MVELNATMEQHVLKVLNNCLYTNIYSDLEHLVVNILIYI
jgi:hypothetical protein